MGAWMKVIGVGFGRTGTASLKLALEQLGLDPCYHMAEVLAAPERIDDWARVANGEPVSWDEVFRGYQATVDWPGAAVWKELVDAYPDAKVLLSVRDPEKWYTSASNTIFQNMRSSRSAVEKALGFVVGLTRPAFRTFGPTMQRLIVERQLGGDVEDRATVLRSFEAHTAAVQAYVPASRLLTYEVTQGWEPLCEFLGVPVPDTPFPRVNDTEAFHRMRKRMMVRAMATAGAAVAGLVGAVAVVASLVRRARRS
jgi:hypothetical protein